MSSNSASSRHGKAPDGETIGGFRLGFGKKRGRKEDSTESERKRLTASATFLVFKILGAFEQPITELKTKFDKFVNTGCPGGQCVHQLVYSRKAIGYRSVSFCLQSRNEKRMSLRGGECGIIILDNSENDKKERSEMPTP